jgi:hypothetical protein
MSVNESDNSSYIEISQDISTLIGNRHYSLALLAMYREGNPTLQRIFPKLEYQISENTKLTTQLSEQQIAQLIKYTNDFQFNMVISSMTLVFFGGMGILMGVAGIIFFLQRTSGVVTFEVAVAPIFCLGLPLGLPICIMGMRGILSLRKSDLGMF